MINTVDISTIPAHAVTTEKLTWIQRSRSATDKNRVCNATFKQWHQDLEALDQSIITRDEM